MNPPTTFTDHYIPPKTKHDVPVSFTRPEDEVVVVEEVPPPPPPPELIPSDVDPDAESFPPEAFLGLAKLTDSKEEDDEDEDEGNDLDADVTLKLADSGSPKLPPMPTVAPQPANFLPLLEELSPGLLNSLRTASNVQVRQQKSSLI